MKPVAVIDIGSNSVRLVVYDGLKRVPNQLLNEKYLCGLARDMNRTGCLYAEGKEEALQMLDRFSVFLKTMKVKDVHAIATSAVRDASDGSAFIETIHKRTGIKVEVIDGEREAHLSSAAVQSAFMQPKGVVTDLGGGSLELAAIQGKAITNKLSLPIGPLRLQGQTNMIKHIDAALAEYPFEKMLEGQTLYAIGGGFRALAKWHMQYMRYPLRILHHYKLSNEQLLKTSRMVSQMPIERLLSVTEKRRDTLPLVATIMERMLLKGRPNQVIFSAYGIREGLVYEKLSDDEQQKDLLISACHDGALNHYAYHSTHFFDEVYEWLDPLFTKETKKVKRLRYAACLLSSLAWHENPSYRAEMAYRWILDSALPGVDHEERAFIAQCLYYRYSSEADSITIGASDALLDESMRYRAQVIGNAIRFAYRLSGGQPDILPYIHLAVKHRKIALLPMPSHKKMITKNVLARMQKLADLLDYKIESIL